MHNNQGTSAVGNVVDSDRAVLRMRGIKRGGLDQLPEMKVRRIFCSRGSEPLKKRSLAHLENRGFQNLSVRGAKSDEIKKTLLQAILVRDLMRCKRGPQGKKRSVGAKSKSSTTSP